MGPAQNQLFDSVSIGLTISKKIVELCGGKIKVFDNRHDMGILAREEGGFCSTISITMHMEFANVIEEDNKNIFGEVGS